MSKPQSKQKLEAASKAIAGMQGEHDADVLVFNGPIGRDAYHELLDYTKAAKGHPNVMLLLATYGGDPHAAYRIARCLQNMYEKVTVFLAGVCKSAGTLIALGAHQIVMSDSAELGPLDIQLRKSDEIVQVGSALDTTKALEHLTESSTSAFRSYLVEISLGTRLPTKLVSEIATNITVGLFSKIYEQIDPVRLGEIVRATNIAMDYGERLSKNLKPNALEKLVHGYHAHGFVIDRKEAANLFQNIRAPNSVEQVIADLFIAMREPETEKATISILEPIPVESEESNANEAAAKVDPAPAATSTGNGGEGRTHLPVDAPGDVKVGRTASGTTGTPA